MHRRQKVDPETLDPEEQAMRAGLTRAQRRKADNLYLKGTGRRKLRLRKLLRQPPQPIPTQTTQTQCQQPLCPRHRLYQHHQ